MRKPGAPELLCVARARGARSGARSGVAAGWRRGARRGRGGGEEEEGEAARTCCAPGRLLLPPRHDAPPATATAAAAAAAAAAASPQPGIAHEDCRMFGALSAPVTAQSLVSSFPEVSRLRVVARELREKSQERPARAMVFCWPPSYRYCCSRCRRLRPVNFPCGRWEFWETRRSASAAALPPPAPGRGSGQRTRGRPLS